LAHQTGSREGREKEGRAEKKETTTGNPWWGRGGGKRFREGTREVRICGSKSLKGSEEEGGSQSKKSKKVGPRLKKQGREKKTKKPSLKKKKPGPF